MESNLCDGNRSDSNVLLPPRKRLLAGFKKQNSDNNLGNKFASNKKGVSDSRINALMKRHLENPNLSLEEIVEKSSRAVEEAVNVAVAARAMAVEKEEVAAKAVVRAKGTLELVADITDEMYSRDKYLKKQLPVKIFYDRNGNIENRNEDEEIALRLPHSMNNTPRITKNSANSNLKTNKHKKMKGLSIDEGPRVSINGHGEEESGDSFFENASKRKHNSLNIGNGEVESVDDLCGVGRKRGRVKQKKLSLSICSNKDLANTNEEVRSKGTLLNGKGVGKDDNSVPAQHVSMSKCKAFRSPDCVEGNKVMEP